MTPQEYRHAVRQITLDSEARARVLRRSLGTRREHVMNPIRNLKRMAVTAAAVLMAFTVTAYAAAKAQSLVTFYDETDVVETLPEAQEALTATGSGLTLPQEWNGYIFTEAQMTHQMLFEEVDDQEAADSGDGSEESGYILAGAGEYSSGLSCVYTKDGETVTLEISRLLLDAAGEYEVVELDGQTFYYRESENVSVYYSVTADGSAEEDAEQNIVVEDGAVAASGAEESVITTGTIRSIHWQADGVCYTISQIDGPLTWQELCRMALMLMAE